MTNSPNSSNNSNQQGPIWVAIFLGALVLLLMVLRINVVAFLLLLSILLVAFGIGYLIRYQIRKKRRIKFEQSTEGMIARWMTICEEQIARMTEEQGDIQFNINELQAKLAQTPTATVNTRKETENLITAFKKERQLRETKISFYTSCKEKLRTLKVNQDMVKTISDKKEKLKALQENHYVDIANMEELRSQLAHDQRYLETIETLSLRMLESTDLDAAESLQLELNKLTEEVRRL